MKVCELAEALGWEVLTLPAPDSPVTGLFCGDLHSWAMGRAEAGCCWSTVMGNVNTVAVASLKDVACVVLAEDAAPVGDMVERASAAGVNLLRCPLPEFETALAAAKVLGLV